MLNTSFRIWCERTIRVRTLQLNLVEYECEPDIIRHLSLTYDVNKGNNLKDMSDRFNSSIGKYFYVDEICSFCGLV